MNRSTYSILLTATALLSISVSLGCDNSPPPPRVPVPAQGTLGPPRYDPAKPLPGQVPQAPAAPAYPQPVAPIPQTPPVPAPVAPAPAPMSQAVPGYDPRIAAPPAGQVALPQPVQQGAFDDQPILRERPPEQRAFVDAYNRVGRPRIAIYVNRTLDGNIIPPTPIEPQPAVRVDRNANVNWDPYRGGQVTDRIDVYLKPGQYDEAYARSLDYEAVENILTDWMAASGNTEIISPTLARARLTEEQRQALEKGEKFVLTDITQRLDADVFIQVQARPTRQTQRGLEIRLVAEALNTRAGRSIGRAVVDVPPPLAKTTINEYTRFLARKLMDDMIMTWSAPAPASAAPAQVAPAAPAATPPSTQP